MTEDRLMTDELVVYRINIAPEVLPKLIFAKGVRMFEVVNGLPEDVYWLRSGWDYMRGCLYVEYANKNMEGLRIPDFYVMVTIIPEYRELSYQDWKRQIPKHEYDRLVLGNFYQDEGGGE